jgi:hypothetical protein
MVGRQGGRNLCCRRNQKRLAESAIDAIWEWEQESEHCLTSGTGLSNLSQNGGKLLFLGGMAGVEGLH